jgi:hypothetical protein
MKDAGDLLKIGKDDNLIYSGVNTPDFLLENFFVNRTIFRKEKSPRIPRALDNMWH